MINEAGGAMGKTSEWQKCCSDVFLYPHIRFSLFSLLQWLQKAKGGTTNEAEILCGSD